MEVLELDRLGLAPMIFGLHLFRAVRTGRGPDRTAFYELVRRSCSREGLYGELSPKLRAKRQAVG